MNSNINIGSTVSGDNAFAVKVAYVVLQEEQIIGIENKIREKAEALASIGLRNFEIVVVNPDSNMRDGPLRYVSYRRRPFPFNRFDVIFRRYDLIESALDLRKYDLIILRYPAADRSGVAFVRRHFVIMEHHSLVLDQYRAMVKTQQGLARKLLKYIRYFLERRYRRQIIAGCRAMIAVTDEIRHREQVATETTQRPAVTIPNGIDVGSVPLTGFQPFNGRKLDVAFVASSYAPWHGIERIVSAVLRYTGAVDVALHFIGDLTPNRFNGLPQPDNRFRYHGLLKGSKLDDIMSEMTLGISTLGLYKKNMHEACSLKTREYTARGLPFILGYEDPALRNVDPEHRFFLKFENSNTPIDFVEIIRFAERISHKEHRGTIVKYMRQYAREHMDTAVKMRQYAAFVAELLTQESGREGQNVPDPLVSSDAPD